MLYPYIFTILSLSSVKPNHIFRQGAGLLTKGQAESTSLTVQITEVQLKFELLMLVGSDFDENRQQLNCCHGNLLLTSKAV